MEPGLSSAPARGPRPLCPLRRAQRTSDSDSWGRAAPGRVYDRAVDEEALHRWIDARVAAALPVVDEAARGIEFARYVCAAGRLPLLAAAVGTDEDTLRTAVRHSMRRRLEEHWPRRVGDARDFDAVVTLALADGPGVEDTPGAATADVAPRAVYVAGRYRKLSRGLSQTVFHCRACRGGRRRATCERCGGSGRHVAEAVSEFVCEALREAFGTARATFHGAGREDVDVRMLGRGRPFAVTLDAPRRRTLDDEVANAVAAAVVESSGGRVEVARLCVVTLAERKAITAGSGAKTYELVAEPDDAQFPGDAAERLAALAGRELAQRTPRRVSGRRADLVRARTVRSIELVVTEPTRIVARVGTDPGLYVKELVSGDEGRTEPSFAALLGVPCRCTRLDVLDVE